MNEEENELTEAQKAFNAIDLSKIQEMIEQSQEERKQIHTVALPPEPTIERMHKSSGFPLTPISPATLADKVSEKLSSFDRIVVPKDTPSMVEELCKSFNECIRLNIAGESETLVLSPKTGSAKSVASQMYVALLQEQASIIVVYTVEDAIKTCEHINDWSGNKDYARCTYTISDNNEGNPLRVDMEKLSKHRCIVISHALFKLSNDKLGIKELSNYKGQKREFVLVDERIDLYKTVSFPLNNLNHLLKLFNDVKAIYPLPTLDNDIKFLEATVKKIDNLKELVDFTFDYVNEQVTKKIEIKDFMYLNSELRTERGIDSHDFSSFYKLIEDRVINLVKVLDPLSLFKGTEDIQKNLKAHLDNLSTILKYNFYYFPQTSNNSGGMIMVTKNLLNEFGSSVVLDATATINNLYDDKAFANPDKFKHIETVNPKIYNNFTINTCRGVPQGKHSIYGSLANNELDEIVDIYKEIAKSLLTTKDDELLVITHKDFREILEKKLPKSSVQFTHWGDHRGKNKWSSCNKILVIGWYYLPQEVHYINYINAVNKVEHLSNEDFKDIKRNYSGTQIVDDLVQAVNRGAVRNTISEDGNCTKSEVYMFYPNTTFGNDVMETFEAEFKGATVCTWEPKGLDKIQKLAKSYGNIKRVADYIERQVLTLGEIKQSVVQTYFDKDDNPERLKDGEERIARSTVDRAIKHTEFNILLESKGIHRVPLNSKSFIFKPID